MRKRKLEFAAVSLLVLGRTLPIVLHIPTTKDSSWPPVLRAIGYAVSPIPAIAAIFYLIYTTEGPEAFGLRKPKLSDLAYIPIAVVIAAGTHYALKSLASTPASTGTWAESGVAAASLLILSNVIQTLRDELFFRAYVNTRLDQFFGIPAVSCAASAVAYALASSTGTLASFGREIGFGLIYVAAFRLSRGVWASGAARLFLRLQASWRLLG